MGVVGYYDMTAGQGGAYQEDEITANGLGAVNVTTLDGATLAGLDTLYVANPDNSGFGASYPGALSDVETAVLNGMNLLIFDRTVTDAQTILPGGAGLVVVRDSAARTEVDLAAGAPSWFTNGPAGPIDSTMFDGGNSSNHGYVALASLPPGAIPLLTNGNPDQVVAFVYPHGDGMVFYSTIPLDYYSYGGSSAITDAEVATIVGNLLYGFGLVPPICFAAGTRIATPMGGRAVESLAVGEMLCLRGGGVAPVRWIGRRDVDAVDLLNLPQLRPVRIATGALGNGLPLRDLVVSRQHRLLVPGMGERLIAAIHLVGLPGVAVDEVGTGFGYFHLLLDRHEILFAEGLAAESLHLGRQAMRSLTRQARREIAAVLGGPNAPVGFGHDPPVLSARRRRAALAGLRAPGQARTRQATAGLGRG